jgi:glycosyltransferase involved in cell wall biosynthesis
MVAGLAEVGEVDFLCAASLPPRPEDPPPEGLRYLRLQPRRTGRVERALAWLRTDLPRAQLVADVSEVTPAAAEWVAGRSYDAAYFSHLHAWRIHHHLAAGVPTIVDLDNLDHLVIRAARTRRPVGAPLAEQAKWLALQPVDLVDERRTERLQRRCGEAVDAVTLCSRLDVERSGLRNAHVIANGYERTTEPPRERDGATFLFVGALGYPPNADAVRWFVREVLPAVREHRPEATVRIVGGGEASVRDLADRPGVEVLGRVADIGTELARATVAVVPIRSGSGTRLKVVEALANRLPVVATTVGVEGIDVVDGVHALVADDAGSFGAACRRLLDRPELRVALADSGERLWEERYRWSAIRRDLGQLVGAVVAGGQAPGIGSRTTAGE